MAKDVKSILRNLIRMYKLQSRENGTPRKRYTKKTVHQENDQQQNGQQQNNERQKQGKLIT